MRPKIRCYTIMTSYALKVGSTRPAMVKTRSGQEVLGNEDCLYLAVKECPKDKEAEDDAAAFTTWNTRKYRPSASRFSGRG